MLLPCAHIFSATKFLNENVFDRHLCGGRWLLGHGEDVLVNKVNSLLLRSLHLKKPKILSNNEKFARVSNLCKDLLLNFSELGQTKFSEMERLLEGIISGVKNGLTIQVHITDPSNEDSSVLTWNGSSQEADSIDLNMEIDHSDQSEDAGVEIIEALVTKSDHIDVIFQVHHAEDEINADQAYEATIIDKNEMVRVTFLDDDLKDFMDSIKLPKRAARTGRPKGSDQTVIGLSKTRVALKKVHPREPKKRNKKTHESGNFHTSSSSDVCNICLKRGSFVWMV